MVKESDLWMSDDAVCVTCDVAFQPPASLPKEIWGMIMCRPCADFAWSVLRGYASGDASVETLSQIQVPKREMMRQSTVDLFARNYARLTGKKEFTEWFNTHTIGPEKNPDKPAVGTFLEWVRNTYNQHRRAKPMGPRQGITAKLGDIAKVTMENPPQPKPAPDVVITSEEVNAEVVPSEKEKTAKRRKRSETQDAPVPGAEVQLSLKGTPKAASTKIKSAADKLSDKIDKDAKKLRDKIDKDADKLRK